MSSDFEVRNDEEDKVFYNRGEDQAALSYGAISKIIVHDVLNSKTVIMPFRNTKRSDGKPIFRFRASVTHHWRKEDGTVLLLSLAEAEPLIEGDWHTDERAGSACEDQSRPLEDEDND